VRLLRAFLLGAAAVGAMVYAAATTVALAVAAAGGELALGVGPLVAVAVEPLPEGGSATTLGPGIAALAVAGGLINAAAAVVLSRGSR
jgi:hypothetical protein